MYNLIIADDEVNIRNSIKKNIDWEKLGFVVTGLFENGHQALDHIEHNETHAALMDIRMPGMDGLEFARRVYKKKYPLKIVFLSGYGKFEYARQALEYGVQGYVLKPLDWDELVLELIKIKESLDTLYGVSAEDEYPQGYYKRIKNMVRIYLETNYRTATLESAAVKVYISPNYLSKIFKREMGMTFSEYLLEVKMKKAKELLLNIENKIYDIAFAVGYDNPKNFSRAFKQYSGKTPREFREAGQ
jgi:YesN/AraC family two-component response regulator